MKKIIWAIALCLSCASFAQADVVAFDNFDYQDGSLVPNGGWANHSGTVGDLLVAGGQAVVQHGVPSEDANLQFLTKSTGVLTAAFDINVNASTVIGGGDFEYFAHFFTAGSFNFRSRVDISAPTGAGDYTLGISSDSSVAEAILTNDFSFGDTVSVLIGFDLADGTGSLTVNGETVFGAASGGGQTLNAFALRQSDSSNNESVAVDNLIIAIPEPATAVLFGLAGLGLCVVRRRS